MSATTAKHVSRLSWPVLLLALLLGAQPATAQDDETKDNAYYSKLYTQRYKQYVKDPDNVAHNVALADFFCDTLNPQRNYAQAMKYITFAEKQYITIIEDRSMFKEVNRLIKQKITLATVREQKKAIVALVVQELSSEAMISDAVLESYTTAFKDDPTVMRLVEGRQVHSRYLQAQRTNTMAAYKEIYTNYPSTLESEAAEREMSRLASERIATAQREGQVDTLLDGFLDVPAVQRTAIAKKSAIAYHQLQIAPTPKAYHDFLNRYSGSDEYTLVLNKMDEILLQEFNALTTPREYADFAIDNPDNALADKAMERLRAMITEERDIRALKIYMEEFPLDVKYNDIYLQYYKWYTEEGNRAPIEHFIEVHPDFPYRTAVEDDLAAADRRDQYDVNMPFREEDFGAWKTKILYLTGKKISFVALQRTMQQLIASRSWSKIPERINKFDISFGNYCVDEVAELKSIVSAPEDKRLTPTTMVVPVYDMMHPVRHPDGRHLYYHRLSEGADVIYVAQFVDNKKGGQWRAIGKARFTNLENRGLHIYSFYDGGRKMLLGQNGNILMAELHDDVWTALQLPEPVNSPYNDYDAYMLPDSSGMLLASDRPGGYNMQLSRSKFHGDTALASDIYFVPLTAKGWGEPVNLGFHVNSQYMECSPSISSDLKTLYFITDGRGGLGYGDLYYTTRDDVNDWVHWAKPTNYGKETNTGFNEYSAVLDADGKHLTLCSNAKGHYGSFQVAAIHTINNQFKTINVKSTAVGYTFDLYDMAKQKKIVERQNVEQQGVWKSSFYSNKQYILLAQCAGLYMPGIRFTPGKTQQIEPVAYEAAQLLELTASDKPMALPCIDFADDGSTLTPYALAEIDHLADFLQRNSALAVEFLIHVDGTDDASCFKRSQAQGKEIKNRLISKGIEADRVAISGFGNSQTKRGTASSGVTVYFREF